MEEAIKASVQTRTKGAILRICMIFVFLLLFCLDYYQ